MENFKPKEPEDSNRREKIDRRLMIFGVLVILLSLVWHIGYPFIFGQK